MEIFRPRPFLFQSTPSARRATAGTAAHAPRRHNFNPRPPRGGRRLEPQHTALGVIISIHALREEGDVCSNSTDVTALVFQSTPSARRATRPTRPLSTTRTYFNPRPPRGGRPFMLGTLRATREFQSTPSARRATHELPGLHCAAGISIHALREEGDQCRPAYP